MKKIVLSLFLLIIIMSLSTTFAAAQDGNAEPEQPVMPETKEKTLSQEEINRFNRRIEEIRNMDKTDMSSVEKKELKEEAKVMKEAVRKSGSSTIIISGSTLLLIILLIIIL